MEPYSILVIDDEPDNFETIEALLPPDTYDLHYASSGTQAIASLDKYEPDLILLDIMMPGMDGFETCRTIKSIARWQPVPIIIITALSSKQDLARCLAEGAEEFLTKPVDALELRARIHSMLRIKKQYDRIESLSKLQRNNIKSLEDDLSEIGHDLTTNFSQALSTPLKQIRADLKSAIEHGNSLEKQEIIDLLTYHNRLITEVDNSLDDFWLYLEFLFATKQFNFKFKFGETCMSKSAFEQSLFGTDRLDNSICDIVDTPLAVSVHHYQWIVHKVLNEDRGNNISIIGKVIDRMFHLIVKIDGCDREGDKLPLGMKIVSKIVESYGGVLTRSILPENKLTIYITLPVLDS